MKVKMAMIMIVIRKVDKIRENGIIDNVDSH